MTTPAKSTHVDTPPIRLGSGTKRINARRDSVTLPSEEAVRRAESRLRTLLRLNSAFSTVTGAIGLVAAAPVADFLDVDQVWIVRALGAGLAAFAAIVFHVSRTPTAGLTRGSLVISVNDLGWVAGTIAVIAFGLLSTGGAIAMGLIGVVVLELGLFQMRARTRLLAAITP